MERRPSQTSSRCEYRPGLKKAHHPSNHCQKIERGRPWNTNSGVGRHYNSRVTIVSALQVPLYVSILGDFLDRDDEQSWLGVYFDTHPAFCISITMNRDSRPCSYQSSFPEQMLPKISPVAAAHHFLYAKANVYEPGKIISFSRFFSLRQTHSMD